MLQLLFYINSIVAQTLLELQVSKWDYQTNNQTTFNQMFKLIINPQYDYIMIELKIQSQDYQNVMLTYQQMKEQSFEQVVYDKIDNNGYAQQKSYQYILLSNDEIDTTNNQYITVFSTSAVIYKISAIGYNNVKPCPNDCNNQGSCFQGKCLCNDGWIDEDCSIKATKIQIGSAAQITNYISKISYAYYESTSNSRTLQLTFDSKSESNIQINMLIADSIYLPTKKYSEQMLILNSSSSTAQIVFKEEKLNNRLLSPISFQPSILVMSFQGSNKDDINYPISVSCSNYVDEEEDSTILIITITLPVVFGILAIALCFYCVLKIRNRRKLVGLNKQASITKKLEDNLNKNIDSDWKKSQEEFNPIMIRSNLQKINDNQCSICLENWNDDRDSKQTPCGHFFHNNCISLWLQKHPHCPLCRANLSLQDLLQIKFKK